MGTADDNFQDLTKDDSVTSSLKDSTEPIDQIKDSIDSIKDQISDLIINNSDTIDNYGKLGFKIIFSVLVVVDAGIAATMLLFR